MGSRTPSSASDEDGLPSAGDVVAERYVVEAILGSGNMGVVVRARHKALGHLVAIKFVKRSVLDDDVLLARFTREARALVSVESDHVVRVLDFGTLETGAPYMVMEYLTGHDLSTEMRARRELPPHEAVGYVVQACRGLADIHAHGVVHRDIKPANLFLTRTPAGTVRVKIVDFGISKTPKQTEEELTLTHDSMAIGSPHYMAPEQFRDAKNVDHRADLWALGVILHRAITGAPPFEADSVGALFAAVAADPPTPLREEKPELPAGLEQVILKCLEKKPGDRYQSADELARALEPYTKPTRSYSGDDVTELRRPAPMPAPPDLSLGEVRAAPRPLEQSGTGRGSVLEGERTEPRRRKGSAVVPLAVAAGLAVVAAIALVRGASPARPSAAATGSSPPPLAASAPRSAPTMLTEVPPPKTTSAEAGAAYQMAMQAVRDGSLVVAYDQFERAAQLDPAMAAAHLRAAVHGDALAFGAARAHYRSAHALRAALSPRDLALLEALEPLFLREPPEPQAAAAAVDALAAATPGDVELAYVAMLLFAGRRPLPEGLLAADRVLALDPKLAAAWWEKALLHEREDDVTAALGDVDACLAASPAAASCLHVRARALSYQGKCEALESDAKRMLKIEPGSHVAEGLLARALYARGAPLDAVKEALAHEEAATPESARRYAKLADDGALAVLRGDFAQAASLGAERARAAEAEAEGADDARARAALFLVDVYTESGDAARAGEVADAFLKQSGARALPERAIDDLRPELFAAAVRGGARSAAERDEARTAWLATWEARTPEAMRGALWAHAWAAPAATRDEAEAALLALPRYAPVHAFLEDGWSTPLAGKLYALAGRPDDAAPKLAEVVASCEALDDPFAFVRAQQLLGEALERKGDEAGACAAYAKVVLRWGKARPASVTAAAARARASALGCK